MMHLTLHSENVGSSRPSTRDRAAIPERFTWDLSHL